MRKYSEKFIHEHKKLSNAIIGMEFEFYMVDISYYKTLELLNKELSPVKVHGFRQYHSNFTTDAENFKIEPDLSGGSNMVELITGPLPYIESKYYLSKILNFIQKHGKTNDKCSLHFNISFSGDIDLNDLNVLKLILNTDEDEIYRFFPKRKNNIYAKSVKNLIPFKQYDFFNVNIDSVRNSMKLPNDKYFGINFINTPNGKKDQRIEYRYIGGTDYEKNIGTVLYFMDRFILDSYSCIDNGFDSEDSRKLEEYMEENIHKFKTFSKFENFIVEFPSIELQVDQDGTYDVVDSNFPRMYNALYNLMESADRLKDCIINFDTDRKVLEVVDAQIKSVLTMNKIEFVNCMILDGIYDSCNFHGCEISNSQLTKSSIHNSDVNGSKVLSCHVEQTTLVDCYFMNGFLNGDMEGGIFRSGELGPFSSISSETKIVSDNGYGNFFDTRFDSDGKSDKEGMVKFKK
jgi:hypothetical protein